MNLGHSLSLDGKESRGESWTPTFFEIFPGAGFVFSANEEADNYILMRINKLRGLNDENESCLVIDSDAYGCFLSG
jgi:hypothetical protein